MRRAHRALTGATVAAAAVGLLLAREPARVAQPVRASPARGHVAEPVRADAAAPVRAVSHDAEAHRDASLLWPRLDPPELATGALTARIGGRDPAGPRELVLHRRDGAQAERIARARSRADGRFDFGDVPLPNGGSELVVIAASGDALAPSPVAVRRDSPPPPQLAIGDDGAGVQVEIFPARLEGELLLVDASGAVLWRAPVTGSPERLVLEAAERAGALAIVHRIDGAGEARALLQRDEAR